MHNVYQGRFTNQMIINVVFFHLFTDNTMALIMRYIDSMQRYMDSYGGK